MSKLDVIKKALLLNNVCESDVTVVKNGEHSYLIHIFKMLVLLLYNFFLLEEMKDYEAYNFIMNNFNTIIDVAVTEIEIALLTFENIYQEKLTDVVELHNKDECLLIVAIQDKVNNKLRKG